MNKEGGDDAPRSPFFTTGIRIGSPAITTRGFGNREASLTANLVCDVIENIDREENYDHVTEQVAELCRGFPIYDKQNG